VSRVEEARRVMSSSSRKIHAKELGSACRIERVTVVVPAGYERETKAFELVYTDAEEQR
jgi:hypothetical protein